MTFSKVRIRFRKSGDLRLVSHLDLMRSFERMLRRAALPFRMTEGFHPTPRLVFAQSLPLGVVGHAEVAELELTEDVEPAEVLRRLREQAPPGIDFLSATAIPLKTTARPRRAVYRIPVESPPTDLTARIAGLVAATAVWVDRERPRPRRINIRPYVDSLTFADGALAVSIWLTQEGSARADEVAAVVGVIDPPLIERLNLELLDEVPPEEAARTPKIEPQSQPLNRVLTADRAPAAPRETWGATANGPVVE
ncbi:MAG TPA: TIGR03936 family radical SAM-associated protein [Gemmataceae bacterium]|nr:TIGR03936 family radical SAM-associated protein [Gemmataceae bacterium]